ncbi:MAG: hypothetical protein CMI14_09055 [Oleispira sp.]|jgi:hypothetical protein|nr:hypothetical protein [Oleispira sp.]|tara:strand:- start:1485 stop:2105 length:621 start_codon:yes stop_codon:yes gene_type:complete
MRYISLLLLLASTSTWSEISSLSASELTDTYIKDTTVIVRPEQPTQDVNEKVRVKLKVSPLEETASTVPNESEAKLSAISEDINSYTELNEQAALSTNLQPTLPAVTTQFITPQPSEEALTQIRNAYGIDSDTAIDLTSLSFKDTLIPDIGLPNTGDAQYSTTSDSFTISIPNTGNFNSQNITSPNGEIGINVTPSRIEYTLNLPK